MTSSINREYIRLVGVACPLCGFRDLWRKKNDPLLTEGGTYRCRSCGSNVRLIDGQLRVVETKPYCGNCGQQGDPVILLRRAPDGEPLYICTDRTACQRRLTKGLSK